VSPERDGTPTPPEGAQGAEEHCPICGAPLREDQDWCLRCGTAARTRLAPAPRWRPLLLGIGVVVVLSVAGLAVALVELAGGSSGGGTATGSVTTAAAPASTPAAITFTSTTAVLSTSAPSTVTTTVTTAPTTSARPPSAALTRTAATSTHSTRTR